MDDLMNMIDTPAVLIDLDKLDRNLKSMADKMNRANVNLRPHIKTHKSQYIAHEQLKHGAVGITVASLGEAEVMHEAGIDDILIAYPIVGDLKLERLRKLMETCNVTISLDSIEVAKELSQLGEKINKNILLYVDVDTGLNRCGKSPGEETKKLVQEIDELPYVDVIGIMTHAGHAYSKKSLPEVKEVAKQEAEDLVNTKKLLAWEDKDLIVSVGSTPTAHFIEDQVGVAEARPGAYVFGDRSQLYLGLIERNQCAMTILATVVSTPRKGTAIIDAGSKTFSSDINDKFLGYGEWTENPDVYLERLSEEHGILHLPEGVNLKIGQKITIIPNHCCAVTNLHNQLYGIRNGKIERMINVDARGKTQ